MAAADLAIGSKGKIALKKKTGTWEDATPAALGTGDAFPCLSAVVGHDTQLLRDEELYGEVWEGRPHSIARLYSGNVEMRLEYQRTLLWLALAMGVAGTPTEDEVGVRYTHTLALSDLLSGIFATFGADKVASGGVGSGWRWAACKLNGFTLSYQQGQELRVQFPLLLRDLVRDLATAGWTHATSPETARQLVFPSQGVLRVNAQGGSALGSGNVLRRPASMQLTLNANLQGEQVSGDQIDEPTRNAKPNVKLQLGFSAMATTEVELFTDAHEAGTMLKADFIFTGNTLGGGAHGMAIKFPALSVERPRGDLQGAGRIPFSVELHAGPDTADDSGMGVLKPMELALTNAVSTDPLA